MNFNLMMRSQVFQIKDVYFSGQKNTQYIEVEITTSEWTPKAHGGYSETQAEYRAAQLRDRSDVRNVSVVEETNWRGKGKGTYEVSWEEGKIVRKKAWVTQAQYDALYRDQS